MSDKAGAPNSSTPPVNLTELELTVARDPGSDAVVPLLEAYLGQSRFMEAMVLGKKAIKAKPEDPMRRIMLARVYELQGKIPKALEEMVGSVKTNAAHVPTLIYLGKLQDKSTLANDAIASFKAAIDLDNTNAEAKALLSAKGIVYEKAPPPPPPAPVAPAMMPATPGTRAAPGRTTLPPQGRANSIPPQGRTNTIPPQARSNSIPPQQLANAVQQSAGANGSAVEAEHNGADADAGQAQRARRPRPRREALTEEELGIAPSEAAKGGGLGTTLKIGAGGLAILALLVVGMAFYRVRTEKLLALSKPAKEFLAADSLPSLRKALANFEEMVKIDSGQAPAVASIAYIKTIFYTQYGMQNEKAGAEAAVAKAESDAKDVSLTHVARAMLILKEGRGTDALTLLDKIRTDMGETAALQVAMGDIYLSLGKLDDAGTAYQRAKERSSKEARALYGAGEFLRQIGRPAEALGNFESVLRLDSDHAPSRLGRILLRLEQGGSADVVAAQADMQRLNERSENVGPYYQSLALVASAEIARLSNTGDPKKLLEDARKSLGPIPDVLMAQARVESDNGKHAEAVKLLKDVVGKNPGWLTAHIALVRAQIDAGQFADAEQSIAKAQAAVGKQNMNLAALLIVVRREKRDFKGAEEAAKKAFELGKDHPLIQLELARVHTETKKFPEAIGLLGAATTAAMDAKASFRAEIFTQTATTLIAKGDMGVADAAIAEALKADPNYAPAYYTQGIVLRDGKKNVAEARASFQKYLDKAPKGELVKQATKARDELH